MNFADEDYVRFYTRDTTTWKMMGWQARCVMALMLKGKFDRSGVFDSGGHNMSHAVTAVITLPLEHVEVGLAELLQMKIWTQKGALLIWPNYVEAQNCRRSDRARQAESRRNRATEAMETGVTTVTSSHTPSQHVTPSQAEPSQAERSISSSSGKPSPDKRVLNDAIRQVWEFWKADTHHPKAILDPKRKSFITKRLHEGATVEELCAAIRNRRNDPWLMGSGGKVFDSILTLLRDRDQVERLAALTESATGEYPAETREQRDAREMDALERKARAGKYTDKITEQARNGTLNVAKLHKFMRDKGIPI
jgi:hypothetical protein